MQAAYLLTLIGYIEATRQMAKTATARIRMEPAVYDRFSARAQDLGKDLGPYLLERLLEADRLDDRLAAMHRVLARIEQAGTGGARSAPPATTADQSMLVEMLLLLRQVAGPQKIGVAQGEVKRHGMDIWGGV